MIPSVPFVIVNPSTGFSPNTGRSGGSRIGGSPIRAWLFDPLIKLLPGQGTALAILGRMAADQLPAHEQTTYFHKIILFCA
jgi:hypothetical protein